MGSRLISLRLSEAHLEIRELEIHQYTSRSYPNHAPTRCVTQYAVVLNDASIVPRYRYSQHFNADYRANERCKFIS